MMELKEIRNTYSESKACESSNSCSSPEGTRASSNIQNHSVSILHFIILHCKYRANRKFYGVFCNVLFLECNQKLPAKQQSQASPFSPKLDWMGCAIQQATSKQLPWFFFNIFRIFFLKNFIKNPQTRNALAFLPLNISAVGSVQPIQFLFFGHSS